MKTGFLISGYIPTTLGASSAIAIYSSKVIIGNLPDNTKKYINQKAEKVSFKVYKEEKVNKHYHCTVDP